MKADDPRHGSYAGYIAGDRCDQCRRAAADYQRARYFDQAVLGRGSRLVDKTGTVRRVQALQRIGWSAEDLSAMLGHSRAYLNVAVNRDARRGCNHRTAALVADLYARLHETPGKSDRTRTRAEAKGWPPPGAWLDIDDPDEQPDPGYREHGRHRDLDTVVVERIVGGDWSLAGAASKPERVAVVAEWQARGWPLASLERVTGWRSDRYLNREAA